MISYGPPDFAFSGYSTGIAPVFTDERKVKVLLEILEKSSELSKSTVIRSQREPKIRSSMILNDEVSANAIIKRATRHYTSVINSKVTA
jgi:hypothetical protein